MLQCAWGLEGGRVSVCEREMAFLSRFLNLHLVSDCAHTTMLALLALSPLSLQFPTGATPPAVGTTSSSTPFVGALSRRQALQTASAATAALAWSPLSAVADVRGANENMPKGEKEVNKLLSSYGFSPLKVPSGFSPLVQYIGTAPPANLDGIKVKGRGFNACLLVRFLYPFGWLVESPSITENGEAGNIGANNYVKGDSANFAAAPLPAGSTLADLNKEYYKQWLSSQMSGDVYEDVKVKKVNLVKQVDGTEMVVFDFGYTLLTRAGFTVLRQGVASAQVVDGAVVGVVAATTSLRYKELKESLTTIADSFRAYTVKPPEFSLNGSF
jgi:hypothetical protein